MATLWSKLMAGAIAFREAFLSADMQNSDTFVDFGSRQMRYQFFWALYENSAYRNIHNWSQAMRVQFGLYRHIRNIYNPAFRLGEFWKAHLMGGALDQNAGDGSETPSALPIITENKDLRPAIANLWRWSNWSIKKDVLGLWGAVLGDTCIKVIDDPTRSKVYLRLVNPATLKTVDMDPFGNIKGYVIEEQRDDPRKSTKDKVIYRETATRFGLSVVYRTELNDKPYAWDGIASEWAEDYGFVPMVVTQHNNVGLEWGWSELHPALSKFREVDDLSSKLSDQIRKMVDAPWLFSGVEAPTKKKTTTSETPTANNPEPGREELPALYGPTGSDAKALVANLDISAASQYILEILKDIERDYPELDDSIVRVKADVSGRALGLTREPIEVKVQQRRANYDDAMVRLQQMGVSIGGLRQYPGFESFSLDSYANGQLEHSIGDRPIFSKNRQDDLDFEKVFWDVANAAKLAGYPLDLWLKKQGWSDEDITALTGSAEYSAKIAGLEQLALLGSNPPSQDNQNNRNNQNNQDAQ